MATRKTTIVAAGVSLVLTAALALPAFGDAPTYSGTLLCSDAVSGEQRELNTVTGATMKGIAAERSFWKGSGFCANGSFDTSALTRDA